MNCTPETNAKYQTHLLPLVLFIQLFIPPKVSYCFMLQCFNTTHFPPLLPIRDAFPQFNNLVNSYLFFQNYIHLSSLSKIFSTPRHRWLLCPHLPQPLHWSAFFGFRWFYTKLGDPWGARFSLLTFIFPTLNKVPGV